MKTLSQKLKIPAKCIWKLNNQIPLTKLNKLKFWLHFLHKFTVCWRKWLLLTGRNDYKWNLLQFNEFSFKALIKLFIDEYNFFRYWVWKLERSKFLKEIIFKPFSFEFLMGQLNPSFLTAFEWTFLLFYPDFQLLFEMAILFNFEFISIKYATNYRLFAEGTNCKWY